MKNLHSLKIGASMYSWQSSGPQFTYTGTDHPCPECEADLTLVDDSTMLACSKGHGPYFLIKE